MKLSLMPLIMLISLSSYAQRTVCTATINSEEEREIFTKHLKGKEDFKIIELTDYSPDSEHKSGEDWFQKACEAGIQCDVLMISGHFGGKFFSEKEDGFSLGLDTMEKHSCQNTCDGILKKPKEIFLMGCNTLATKEKDHRTPEQYLQVLLDDGIDRSSAERFVQARYGSLGSSFKDRMRRVFSEVPHIYGFDAVGPSGKTVTPFLNKYFDSIDSYEDHLLQIETQKVIDKIERSNNLVKFTTNDLIEKAMKGTAFAQCAGITPEDPAFKFKEQICSLYNSDTPVADRISMAHSMLSSEDALLFLPSVANFLKEHDWSFTKDSDEYKALQEMKSDSKLREMLDNLFNEYDTPGLKIDFLRLEKSIGWLNEKQYLNEFKKIIAPRIKRLNREDVDFICSLDESSMIDISIDDVDNNRVSSITGSIGLDCLNIKDTQITKHALKVLDKKISKQKLPYVINSISGLPGDLSKLYNKIDSYKAMNFKHKNYVIAAIEIRSSPESEKNKYLKKHILDKDNSYLAFDYIDKHKIKSDDLALHALNSKNIEAYQYGYIARMATDRSSKVFNAISEKEFEAQSSFFGSFAHNGKNKKFGTHVVEPALNHFLDRHSAEIRTSGYTASRILANSELKRAQVDRIIENLQSELKKDEDYNSRVQFIRGVLRSQKHIEYSEDEEKILRGIAYIYDCEYISESFSYSSTICTHTNID